MTRLLSILTITHAFQGNNKPQVHKSDDDDNTLKEHELTLNTSEVLGHVLILSFLIQLKVAKQ